MEISISNNNSNDNNLKNHNDDNKILKLSAFNCNSSSYHKTHTDEIKLDVLTEFESHQS